MRQLRSAVTIIGALSAAAAVLALAPPSLAATSPTATGVARSWHPEEISPPKHAASDPVAELNSVACVSATECMAGGRYFTDSDTQQAIVAPEFKGTWARAHTLVMPKNADPENPGGAIASVACPASRRCVAVGSYLDSAAVRQGFVAAQAGGKWQRAQEISRPANLAVNGDSDLAAVSCVSPGNCVAVGDYNASTGFAMLATREAAGHWKRAFGLLLPPSAGAKANPFPAAVSCWAPGHCAAVGAYADKSDHSQALAIIDTNNRWARATKITPPKKAKFDVALFGVWCDRAGECTAVGNYEDAKFASHAMAVTRGKHGWLPGSEIPAPAGITALGLNAISCSAAGSCVAAGAASKASGTEPIVATETSGRWTGAAPISLPANAMGPSGADAPLASVACLKGSACTAVGYFIDKSGDIQALVSSKPAG